MSSRVIEVVVVQVTYCQMICTYRRKCGMHHYVELKLQSAEPEGRVVSDPKGRVE